LPSTSGSSDTDVASTAIPGSIADLPSNERVRTDRCS
jgi:hypothetical protein